MMIRNRFVLKSVAALLILLTLNNLFFPALSYALTAGPTAPEYTSFEPVDTTDMVNLATGDFTYNIPLLEVPGPEGGYPLSLSYHAGIQPGEEASWVGLGWTLNPGAINRTVNGYPDDHSGTKLDGYGLGYSGAKRKVTDNWEGGSRSTFSVGVGLPGASFGLQFSQDTYQGFGVGSNFGVGVGIGGENSPLGVGINRGVGPYGGGYASAGISAGIPIGGSGKKGSESAARLGGSIGVATNFESVSAYAGSGVSVNGETMLGASISSNGLKPRFSVAGNAINQVNSNAGRMTVDETSFSVPIPLGPSGAWLNLGYNYQRYYSNEESEVNTWGTLHPVWKDPKDNSFDSYGLLDPDAEGGIVDNAQADKVLGGSMPAFDHYSVTGQGLSGSMQPYLFQNFNMYRQNVHKLDNKGDNLIEYKTNYTPYSDPLPVAFRFNNDFANTAHFRKDPVVDRTDNRFVRFDNSSTVKGDDGFNNQTGHLAGSKHVEYFTNEQIHNGDAYHKHNFVSHKPHDQYVTTYSFGKIDKDNIRTFSSHNISDQIGGFMITNESGVTYHYSLPVYAYDERIYTETLDNARGKVYNFKEHPQPYAYTWLLTAITGPDYINRSQDVDGTISEDDWGYWVKFHYGKWTENYQWRNPSEGWHKDIDRDYQNCSYGRKELYYLDAVQTRTHTAIFEKEIRNDSKGVAQMSFYGENPSFGIQKAKALYYPVQYGLEKLEGLMYRYSVSTLKLKNIYLVKNTELTLTIDEIRSRSETYNHQFNFSLTLDAYNETYISKVPISDFVHSGLNVIDTHDIADIKPKLGGKSLRVIEFEHSYKLSPNTTNSFSLNYTNSPSDSDLNSYLDTTGKLTLESLKFLGKSGFDAIPPMTFGYGNYNPLYEQEYYDMWGYYKSDYKDLGNENLNRLTTATSAQHTDAWSLKKIKTSLGATINITYESDTYLRSILAKQTLLRVKDVQDISQNKLKISFHESNVDLHDVLKVNDILSVFISGWHIRENGKIFFDGVSDPKCYWINGSEPSANENISYQSADSKIIDVLRGAIIVEDPILYEKITGEKTTEDFVWDEESKDGKKYIFVSCGESESRTYHSAYMKFFGFPDKIAGGYVTGRLNQKDVLGGGIRVTSIGVDESDIKQTTSYNYSKGVTSYEPFGYLPPVLREPSAWYDWEMDYAKKQARKFLDNKYSSLLANAREVSPPGVVYEKVTVTEETQIGNQDPVPVGGANVYTFQTFEENMIQRDTRPCEGCTNTRQGRALTFRDFSTRVGALKKVEQYGAQGQLLAETINHYLYDEADLARYKEALLDRYNGQGLISQVTNERRVVEIDGKDYDQVLLTAREEYPTVIVGSTTINHKTGLTTSTRNLAFDFFSGVPTEVMSEDSYGNKYVSVTTPAYHFYEQMGPKVRESTNKHMLTQQAEQMTYKINANFDPQAFPQVDYQPEGLLSASVQTWSDQIATVDAPPVEQANIWRKHRSYLWTGEGVTLQKDGTAPIEAFTLFQGWNTEPEDQQWEKQSEITLYDPYSHALEAYDVNEDYAATRLDNEHKRVIATVANARYDEFAYSGAESLNRKEGGVDDNGAIHNDQYAHTGQYSLAVAAGKKGFSTNHRIRDYRPQRASVWVYVQDDNLLEDAQLYVKYGSGEFTVSAEEVSIKAGAWHLINFDLPLVTTTVEVGCRNAGSSGTIYFDDFRVHPLDAAMISYVYDDKTDELTHILNTDNFYTRFEYDEMGRLVATFQEIQYPVERQISKQNYYYQSSQLQQK